MDRNLQICFEFALLDQLAGQLRLLEDFKHKIQSVEGALTEVFRQDTAGQYADLKVELEQQERRDVFIKEFLSFGLIQGFLGDLQCEDIVINALKPIFIHHSELGLIKTDKQFANIDELNLFLRKLVVFSGRKIMDRVMNIELPNLEGRINIIASPFGPQLTITKAKMTPLSVIDLVEAGSFSYEVAAQLWLYLEGMSIRPANILIAGGPGVGKTTLLNALFSFIPEGDRMVIMEDTLELNSDFEDSCSRLESGEGLTLADLVKNSLRMRPERIIVGEVRGEEARDMMTAANVGKYCVGTIHALTAREAIIRLQNEPMNIPEQLIRLIDAFIVLKRYHVEGKLFRVIDEVSETSGMEQEKVLLSHIFKYDYETNKMKAMSTSTVYRDRLAKQAGISAKEIILEVQLRTFLLQQLGLRGHKTLREVTSFCRAYNKDPGRAVAGLGFDRKQLLGKK